MKISKVNHTRAAVSIKQGKAKGILYRYPVQKKNGKLVRPVESEFDKHFEEINKNAKRLYDILSPEIQGRKFGSVPAKLRSKIKKYFKKIVDFNDTDPQSVLKKQLGFISGNSEDMGSYLFEYEDEPYIHALVSAYIRKSLRKNVKIKESEPARKCSIPAVAEKLIGALCVPKKDREADKQKSYHKAIDAIGEDELEAFLNNLNNDYTRSLQKDKIKKSIDNQNVKASVINKDGRYLLQPSFAGHEKKKAIYDFMLEYADGNDDDRTRLLGYIRGLVVLYIYGQDVYNELLTSGIILKDFSPAYLSTESVFCTSAADLFLEKEPKGLKRRLREKYELELVEHYKKAIGIFEKAAEKELSDGLSKEEKKAAIKKWVVKESFWLDFIEQEVKGIINLSKPDKEYKNNALYLSRKVWKRWTAFMAEKYIDFGKAVYHFAIPKMPSDKNIGVKVGFVRKWYRDGLTSFDYEHIKAVENMERSVSIAVTFAVNNFSRATMKNPSGDTTDVLFLKDLNLETSLYDDTGRRILRYFGGFSQWESNDVVKSAANGRGINLFSEVRKQLETLRNGSYHYTQKFDDTEAAIIPVMLEAEKGWLLPLIRKKYFSNNTHWFYSADQLEDLIRVLYIAPAARGDQIPAFNRLYSREKLFEETEIFLPKIQDRIKALGLEKLGIFQGAAFFLFKEIYYYAFLKDSSIAHDFRDLVFSRQVRCDNVGALRIFRDRIKEIPYYASMGEIAQTIMTDYNLQNQQKETAQIVSSEETKEDREKYKSFPMILYKYMRLTFIEFLRKNVDKYGFLFDPDEQADQIGIGEDEFCAIKTVPEQMMFSSLSLRLPGKKSTAPWYVLGHMISPSHLNHLSGDLRSYIRYLRDIDNRAYQTGNKNSFLYRSDLKEIEYFEEVLNVLEFCRLFCGRTSKEVTDYFYEGQYAREIFKYVDIEGYPNRFDGRSDEELLADFCKQKTGFYKPDGTPQTIGLYHDGTKPILNRNLVLALLYGTDKIISKAVNKVTRNDVLTYYQNWNSRFSEEAGKANDANRYFIQLRNLQNRKNHVELVNVKIYSDILNDLVTQLVSWAYFRERDLMYLALGMQYMRIIYGKRVAEDSPLRRLCWTDVVNIQEGAVLYQILALYTYRLPFYQVTYKSDGIGIDDVKEIEGMFSKKEKKFKIYCHGEDILRPALYFFEVEKDKNRIRNLRNYIDHFAYFVNADRSILDLYSDFYNMFFSYSENFRKSITFILPNILSRYFVLTGIHLNRKTRESETTGNVRVLRNCAAIEIDDELKSYQFKHNLETTVEDKVDEESSRTNAGDNLVDKGKENNFSARQKKKVSTVEVDARDAQFLKDINQILHYRNG